MVNKMYEIISKYGHSATEDGVLTIHNEWAGNKHNLLELLSRHSAWDKNRLAVVLKAGWTRPADTKTVGSFFRWIARPDMWAVWQQTEQAVKALEDGAGSALVTEDLAMAINAIAPDTRAVKGQKVSRAINKMCCKLGIDNNVHYNRKFAMFADACASHSTERVTVISVNPLDYLTMSFGNGWRSCHTIDRENIRNADGNGYSGCYCSGTLSYMMDESSVVCFTLRDDADIADYEADKITRCMFHISDDGSAIVQGRVYPQSCDSDDGGYYAQYRAIVQNVIADCLRMPSMWSVKKGTGACSEVTTSTGTHYRDYTCFTTCNVSRLKTADGTDDAAPVKIRIGHRPICPDCGGEHTEEKSLCCEGCEDTYDYHCEHCGTGFNDDDYDIVIVNGEAYCDTECAYAAGYRYCVDIDEWSVDWFYDDFTGEYFYDSDDIVQTEDGYTFSCCEHAYDAGYMCTTDGEWYREENVYYCERCDRYVYRSEWNTEYECCDCCEDDARAEREAQDIEDNALDTDDITLAYVESDCCGRYVIFPVGGPYGCLERVVPTDSRRPWYRVHTTVCVA